MSQSTSQEVRSCPADLDDLLAQKVSWLPVMEGGSYTISYILDVSARSIHVKEQFGHILLGFPPFMIGLAQIAVALRGFLDEKAGFGHIAFATIGAIFAFYGLVLAHGKKKLLTFDKVTGRFFGPGRYISRSGHTIYEEPKAGDLADIYALQVIPECADSEKNITRYELNLVLHGGERVNVMYQGSPKKITEAALTLGQVINVPVWGTAVTEEEKEARNWGKKLIGISAIGLFSLLCIFVIFIILFPNGIKKHYHNPEVNRVLKGMPDGILNPDFCDFNRVTADSQGKKYDLWGTMELPIMEAGNRVHAFMRNTVWEPNGVVKQADAAALFYIKGNVEVSYMFLLNSGSPNQCTLSWKTVD